MQSATAFVLANMLKDHNRLLCVVGAGKGKSRVAAALAFLFLVTTKKQVYIVFSDKALMERDKKQCEDLWDYA